MVASVGDLDEGYQKVTYYLIFIIGRCFIMLGRARVSSTVLIQCFIMAHIATVKEFFMCENFCENLEENPRINKFRGAMVYSNCR